MSVQYIGVDLGGTNFKMGLVEGDHILQTAAVPVNKDMTEQELLACLITSVESVITDHVAAIGIGVPGIADLQAGIIYDIQNLPAWKEVHLKNILQDHFNLPVHLNNDANCYAWGVKNFGKGKPYANMVGLSIGTGMGMGVIINHNLYSGLLCAGGEIGMIPYMGGILEEYTGSFFFNRTYGKSAKEMNELAQAGDQQAQEAFSKFGKHVGEALKMIMHLYAPEAIIFGGSISKAYPHFKDSMMEAVQSFSYKRQLEQTHFHVTEQSGLPILGAAALCL